MPNGHGGYVRFFSVIVLIFFAAGLYAYVRQGAPEWVAYVGYGLAALIGERLSYHLHHWDIDWYGGGYASDTEKARARRIYRIAAVVYVIAALVIWALLTAR